MTWSTETRYNLMFTQPRMLVRHNQLLWTVHDLSSLESSQFVTLKLRGVPSVCITVPIASCSILQSPHVGPRAAHQRVSFFEVERLHHRYVVGPTQFKLDAKGNAFRLSDKWISPAPLSFWPKGGYVKTTRVITAQNSKVKTLPGILYTFQITDKPFKQQFLDCHKAMQQLNVRPDLYAGCGTPKHRGPNSWTHTCTAAALHLVYIDSNGTIVILNEYVSVSELQWTPLQQFDDTVFDWALPVISSTPTPVPDSIGADMMGIRSSHSRDAYPALTLSRDKFSSVFQREECLEYLNAHRSVLQPAQRQILEHIVLDIASAERLSSLIKTIFNFDVVGTSNEVCNAVYADKLRLQTIVKWACEENTNNLNVYARPLQRKPFETAIIQFYSFEFVQREGLLWEYCANQRSSHPDLKAASDYNPTNIPFTVPNVVSVNEILFRNNQRFVHDFIPESNAHTFFNASSKNEHLFVSDLASLSFSFQQSNMNPEWCKSAVTIGNMPYLYPTVPPKQRTRKHANVWKTPVHIADLIEMAYGDGKYPNICNVAKSNNAVLLLEPELPPYEVLSDLYAHIDLHHSNAVYCAALAAYGPVGISGTARTTWTVLYEYYNAMGEPQNAFMQYLAMVRTDELLSLAYEANQTDRQLLSPAVNTAITELIKQAGTKMVETYFATDANDVKNGNAAPVPSLLSYFDFPTVIGAVTAYFSPLLAPFAAAGTRAILASTASTDDQSTTTSSATILNGVYNVRARNTGGYSITPLREKRETAQAGESITENPIWKELAEKYGWKKHLAFLFNGIGSKAFKALTAYANGADITDVLKETDEFLQRVNWESIGTIRGAYFVSRTPMPRMHSSKLSSDLANVLYSSVELTNSGAYAIKHWSDASQFAAMRQNNMLDALSAFIQPTSDASGATPIETIMNKFFYTASADKFKGLIQTNVPAMLFRYRGKPDKRWHVRRSSMRTSRITAMTTVYEMQLLYEFGPERPSAISLAEADQLMVSCSNGSMYEKWATMPESGVGRANRHVYSPVENIDMVVTTFVREIIPPPPVNNRAPPAPMASFRVAVPPDALTWNSCDTWISNGPALAGFGFVPRMNNVGSKAANCAPLVSATHLLPMITTAIAKVYARNILIRSRWLKPADKGGRYTYNAAVTTFRENPVRMRPHGLLSSRGLRELYTD